MEDCIFCKIINEQAESAVIWQNDFCTAILDLFPNMHGQTLLLTNKHYHSDVFESMKPDELQQFFSAACKGIKILKNKLKVKRVAMVVEGPGVDHAHIKLYPLHGPIEKFEQKMWWPTERLFFKEYEGYILTKIGPEADKKALQKLAKKISQE